MTPISPYFPQFCFLTSHPLLRPSLPPSFPSSLVLADRLAQFVHFFTLNYSLRPFGASVLIAGYDAFTDGMELHVIEPSGVAYVGVLPSSLPPSLPPSLPSSLLLVLTIVSASPSPSF